MSESSKFALLIASDRYADPELRQLQAPSQDAEALARILENPEIGDFQVTGLYNQTWSIVRQKIHEFLQSRRREDTTLLYFSCHGIKDKQGKLYFATIDTIRKQLSSTAVESTFVNEILDNDCRAEKKVVLLDCCYSGAFEKGKIVKADTQVNATGFFGKGTVVMTSSDSMQYAFEGDNVESVGRGSYFTNALIEGLRTGRADINNDGKITFSELYDYVVNYVKGLSPDQSPTMNAHLTGDFPIFKNPGHDQRSVVDPDSIFQLIRKARKFLEEEQYDNAITLFDSALLLNSGHAEALNGKGLALYKKKKYEEALECFREVLKIKPKNPEASTFVDIITDRIDKERNTAVKYYEKYIDHDDTLVKRTEEKVKQAIDESTQIPAELIKKGDQFYEKAMYQDAILCYDQALKIEPHSELASKNKGVALSKLGKYNEAIDCYDKALEINPNDAHLWYSKGHVFYDMGKIDEARRCYNRAKEINPDFRGQWYGGDNEPPLPPKPVPSPQPHPSFQKFKWHIIIAVLAVAAVVGLLLVIPPPPPTANAGVDQIVNSGDTVTLNGTASTDTGGSIDSSSWKQIGGPGVNINNNTSLLTTFVAPKVSNDTKLEFTLVVTDDAGLTSSPDAVVVIVKPIEDPFSVSGNMTGGPSSGPTDDPFVD